MVARRRRAAAGSGDERGRQRSGGEEGELGGARAPVGYLEHAGVAGDGGGAPERAGDVNRRRRRRVLVGGDLGCIRARVSGRRR